MIPATLLCLTALASPPDTLLPPADRPALPDFAPIPGLGGGEGLSRDRLLGGVAVVNIWYEY